MTEAKVSFRSERQRVEESPGGAGRLSFGTERQRRKAAKRYLAPQGKCSHAHCGEEIPPVGFASLRDDVKCCAPMCVNRYENW